VENSLCIRLWRSSPAGWLKRPLLVLKVLGSKHSLSMGRFETSSIQPAVNGYLTLSIQPAVNGYLALPVHPAVNGYLALPIQPAVNGYLVLPVHPAVNGYLVLPYSTSGKWVPDSLQSHWIGTTSTFYLPYPYSSSV